MANRLLGAAFMGCVKNANIVRSLARPAMPGNLRGRPRAGEGGFCFQRRRARSEVFRQKYACGLLLHLLHREDAAFVDGAPDSDVLNLRCCAGDGIVGEDGKVGEFTGHDVLPTFFSNWSE